MGLRPPAPRAGASAVSPRPHKLDPARRFALRSSRYQWGASLPTLCRQKLVETEGLAPPQPERAARLQRAAFAALPRLEMGARAGFAPATFSL